MTDKKTEGLAQENIKNKVIKEFYYKEGLSCSEISEKIGKSIPIVTKVVNELVLEETIVVQGYAPSSGGRRPLTYSLKSNEKFIVAVAMDQFCTRMAIYDNLSTPLFGPELIEIDVTAGLEALAVLIDNIQAFIGRSGIDKEKIRGVGIGMPGFIDVKNGINHSFFDTGKVSLTTYLKQALELSVFIDNDSCLIALAELKFGAARDKQHTMVVNLGWGIGLGMVVNGEIFRGNMGFAGEFSHMPTADSNELCSCGKQGCLETEASLLAICKKGLEGLKQGRVSSLTEEMLSGSLNLSENAIINAANGGDQFAIDLLNGAGHAIGKGLAVLIHIMNPGTIVLSGRGAKVAKILMFPIQQALLKYAIPRLLESTVIKISQLGYDAELLGAGMLIVENIDKAQAFKRENILNQ